MASAASAAASAGTELAQRGRHFVIEAALGLDRHPPAVGPDDALQDLGCPFVDGRDTHITADLFDLVLVGVTISTVRLDRGVCGLVARLGGEVLRHRALDLKPGLAVVQALGDPLAVGAGGLEPDRVGHDELVGEPLFRIERLAELNPLVGVGDGAIERLFAGPEPEGRHHQPGEPEDLVCLFESRDPLRVRGVDRRPP